MRSRRLVFKSTGGKEERKSCNGEKSEPEILTVSSSSHDDDDDDDEGEEREEKEIPLTEEEEEEGEEEEEEEEEEEVRKVEEEEEEEEEVAIEETRSPGTSSPQSNKPTKEKKHHHHHQHRQQQHQQRRGQQNGNDDIGEGDVKKNVQKKKGLYNFPMHRVSRIIKSERSDLRITHEAVFLINKASEKFLELFCEDAYAYSVQGRKNCVAYNHLSSVVCKRRRFDFLADFVPEKIKAEDALAERKKVET